jgi:Lon protease-like protein
VSALYELPIFPLNTVLFPGGVLPLKIFEQRYMGMASECMREGRPFGVCLIEKGQEVGAPAQPHAVGVEARIVEWDMQQLGVLQVTTRGGSRFRIVDSAVDHEGLRRARVAPIADERPCAVPAAQQTLLALLREIVAEVGNDRIPEPHDYENAVWAGYRYCEVLPIPLAARQKLLELDDTVSRLEIIQQFLQQRGLAQ